MEKDKLHSRLAALDGLRGFAIILVFLNHINTSFIQNILPRSMFGWLFSNGVTGVTFLFILSGFLMSSLYPNPPSAIAFLQKRYTRIFPLFLTMCAVMFVGGLSNTKSPVIFVEILFGFALLTYIIWVFIIKKLPQTVGRIIFLLFLALQMCTCLLYIFWINKLSFAAFSNLPLLIHQGIIFLVNATLTLPFGQYVPMLDGVYWTLVAEVLFYVLYPTIVVPLSKYLAHKPLTIKILFLLSLIPLFGGIHMLSYKIFVLSLIQPALFFYFATGVFLGYLYRNHTLHFEKFSKKIFSGYRAVIPFILFWITVAGVNDLSFLGQTISPWIRMAFAIPLTFFVAILLDKESLFSKFFSIKILAFVGTVSYSIYLSHSLIIHIAHLMVNPTDIGSNIVYVFTVFTITVASASVLFFFLERPYFYKKEEKKKKKFANKNKPLLIPQYIFVGVSLVYIIGVFAAFQSKQGYNVLSFQSVIPQSQIKITDKTVADDAITLAYPAKIAIIFSAAGNNLGLLSVRITHTINKNQLPQQLQFSLQEDRNSSTYSALYNLDEFNSGNVFPFGFPPITNAQGKIFIATLQLTNPQSSDHVVLFTNSMQTVYAVTKTELIKNPKLLISLFYSKIANVLSTPEALFALFLLLPFFIFSLFV